MLGKSLDADAKAEPEDGADGQANVELDENDIPDVADRPDDDDDWAVDVSPEAVKAREKALAAQLKASLILGGDEGGDDDDEDADSPYTQLKVWIVEQKDAGSKPDEKAVLVKLKELGIEKKHKAVLVISENLFGEDVVAEIPKYSKLFKTVSLPAATLCRQAS